LDGELELARRKYSLAKFACAYNFEQDANRQLARSFIFQWRLNNTTIARTAYGAPYFAGWRY
jgi:hypothetical protein